jgi:hypothetical protein
MKEYIEILELAAKEKLPYLVNGESSFSLVIFQELYDANYIKAIDVSEDLGAGYQDPKITSLGREYLSSLIKPQEKWWLSFDRRLVVFGVVIGLLSIGINLFYQ